MCRMRRGARAVVPLLCGRAAPVTAAARSSGTLLPLFAEPHTSFSCLPILKIIFPFCAAPRPQVRESVPMPGRVYTASCWLSIFRVAHTARRLAASSGAGASRAATASPVPSWAPRAILGL